jgi:hypothetical protein
MYGASGDLCVRCLLWNMCRHIRLYNGGTCDGEPWCRYTVRLTHTSNSRRIAYRASSTSSHERACVMCTGSESPSGAPSNTRREEHAPATNEQTTQNGHRLSSGTTTPLHHNTVSPFARDPHRLIAHCGPLNNPSHCIQPSGTITLLTCTSQSAHMWSC